MGEDVLKNAILLTWRKEIEEIHYFYKYVVLTIGLFFTRIIKELFESVN
ncbi:hypothetical protein KHA80_22660 [Anaerobacillus sp. HL2]|nr:hypothetical protein KHA80_22660 [Anaerobacillus sp. HL2]